MVKTCFDLRANLISTKVSASHRKSTQAHARGGQTESQIFNLRLFASPFGQSLRRKSCHCITCCDQRKSFKKIHSASSAATHANIMETVLLNVSWILVSGFSKNVFPEFAGPQIIILRNLLLPFSSNSLFYDNYRNSRTLMG